jgi:hypothetical protein
MGRAFPCSRESIAQRPGLPSYTSALQSPYTKLHLIELNFDAEYNSVWFFYTSGHKLYPEQKLQLIVDVEIVTIELSSVCFFYKTNLLCCILRIEIN